MPDRYTVQEPPANGDAGLTQYLSSEFHRVSTHLHLSYRQIDGATDAGPHTVPVDPSTVLILSYTANRNIIAGASWDFDCTISNSAQQYDSCNIYIEVAPLIAVGLIGTQFVDETSSSKFAASGIITQAIPKGTVLNFYASAVKRTNLTVTDSRLWLIEG